MTLLDKIKNIYPELIDSDFFPTTGTISLENANDGKGDYIAKWNHPTLAKPTDDELLGK